MCTLQRTLACKHIATADIALNLSYSELDDLFKSLGHDKSIHLNIYRQSVVTNDILHVPQFLEKVQGIYRNDDIGSKEIMEETEYTLKCSQFHFYNKIFPSNEINKVG